MDAVSLLSHLLHELPVCPQHKWSTYGCCFLDLTSAAWNFNLFSAQLPCLQTLFSGGRSAAHCLSCLNKANVLCECCPVMLCVLRDANPFACDATTVSCALSELHCLLSRRQMHRCARLLSKSHDTYLHTCLLGYIFSAERYIKAVTRYKLRTSTTQELTKL